MRIQNNNSPQSNTSPITVIKTINRKNSPQPPVRMSQIISEVDIPSPLNQDIMMTDENKRTRPQTSQT